MTNSTKRFLYQQKFKSNLIVNTNMVIYKSLFPPNIKLCFTYSPLIIDTISSSVK